MKFFGDHLEKNYRFFKFSVSPWGIYSFTKQNQSYCNVDFLVLRNFSKEFTAVPKESKDGNFVKLSKQTILLEKQTTLLERKEYRRNNEFSIQP